MALDAVLVTGHLSTPDGSVPQPSDKGLPAGTFAKTGTAVRTVWLAGAYALSAAGCALATVTSRAAFGDLSIYAAGGVAVLHGTPLYQLRFAFGLRFTYPPFAALAFVPLHWLPVMTGRVLVTAATVLALPVTAYLVLRLPPWPSRLARDQATRLALAFSAVAIWLEPERTNLKYGQINVFLVLMVLADLTWIERGRHRGWGGALIGIAAGLKLTPAIFAVYLLATRRYRAAATAAAAFAGTVAVAFALVPGDAAGYWNLSFLDPAHVGRIQNVANQSLLGALARVLGRLTVGPVWLPAAAAVGVAGIALAARAGRAGQAAQAFALCAVTSLLISPISWSHHWVLAVPALLVAVVAAARRRPGRSAAAALGALLAVAIAGWAALIWRVPLGGGHYAELNLTPVQLVVADAYVLVGLCVLVLAASQASTSAFHWFLRSAGAKQASKELRASTASVASSKPNADRTAARLSSTYPPK
jgi:alpha-1,2-mannosyltransferase